MPFGLQIQKEKPKKRKKEKEKMATNGEEVPKLKKVRTLNIFSKHDATWRNGSKNGIVVSLSQNTWLIIVYGCGLETYKYIQKTYICIYKKEKSALTMCPCCEALSLFAFLFPFYFVFL